MEACAFMTRVSRRRSRVQAGRRGGAGGRERGGSQVSEGDPTKYRRLKGTIALTAVYYKETELESVNDMQPPLGCLPTFQQQVPSHRHTNNKEPHELH